MLFQRRQAQILGIILGLITLVVVAYCNAFTAPFIWDDEVMVQANPLIHDQENWGQIFTSSAFGGNMTTGKYYRPIQIFSYALDVHFLGDSATIFHSMNIIYHALTVLMLFFCLRELRFSTFCATFTAALYAVHPINIESVTYISGRGDGLALLFSMISFYAFILTVKGSRKWGILAVIAYVIAILAKENVLAFPLMALLTGILFHKKIDTPWNWKPHRFFAWQWTSLGLLAAMGGYIWFRLSGTLVVGASLSRITEATLTERFLTLPMILWTYLKLFIWPNPLHMEYHFVVKSMLHASFLWGVLALIVLLAFTTHIIKKYPKTKTPILWGSSWFLLGLAPVYQIPFPLAATLREHWASLSFIGLYLLLALLLDQLKQKRSHLFIYAVCIVIIIVLTGLTYQRNNDWRDPMKLYAHDLKYEPQSFLLHNNLGTTYFRMNDFANAKIHFTKAIEVSPYQAYDVAYNNLGVIIENEGNLQQAGGYYLRSIQYGKYHLAYINLTRLLIKMNDLESAKRVAQAGLKEYPRLIELEIFQKAISDYEQRQSYKNNL